MEEKMRIIFMGTPDYATIIFEKLLEETMQCYISLKSDIDIFRNSINTFIDIENI